MKSAGLTQNPGGDYKTHVARLSAACEWLGIDRGRAAQYGALITAFFECNARSRQHVLAYCESCEIVNLFELWRCHVAEFPGLGDKIKKVFTKGPVLREEENPAKATNQARDNAFTYLIGGTLLAAGVPVISVDGCATPGANCESNADVIFRWDRSLIDMECKRPRSFAALQDKTRRARGQIQDPKRGSRDGVIGIDCSILVRPQGTPQGTLREDDSAGAVERFISTEIEKTIVPKIASRLTHSIAGFILFARVPAMIRLARSPVLPAEAEPIYYYRPDSIATWVVYPNSRYAQPAILKHLADCLNDFASRKGMLEYVVGNHSLRT
jgi:hypothetical protein